MAEKYLSVPEVAERLATGERFARRLIEERRIEFKHFGRHVRVAERVWQRALKDAGIPREMDLHLRDHSIPAAPGRRRVARRCANS